MTVDGYFIGLDDTDYGESIGTGALARELMVFLRRQLGVEPLGITRHQFLIHPDIPYTSHNSSACLAVRHAAGIVPLAEQCRRFITFLFHPGADPGLCITFPQQSSAELLAFARSAQTKVVQKSDAIKLARKANILLEEHGGEGIGVIGALCGAVLRMSGEDGRFISHRGLRDAAARTTVGQLIADTAVAQVWNSSGEKLDNDTEIFTHQWVRPELRGNQVVLTVQFDSALGMYCCAKKKKGENNI